jgi:hypothetical protein
MAAGLERAAAHPGRGVVLRRSRPQAVMPALALKAPALARRCALLAVI